MQNKTTKPRASRSTESSKTTKIKNRVAVASDDFDIVVKSESKSKTQSNSADSTHLYFTEKDLSRILSNLDTLRDDVYPTTSEEEGSKKSQPFPSVCLIGLGRCGSNACCKTSIG